MDPNAVSELDASPDLSDQMRRVAIARALVGSPAVILADEPTGALDTRTAAEIMAFPQQLNVAQGVTVVVVTHEPEVAVYAQRILLVRHGRLVQDGTPEQVLSALPTRAA